MLLADVFENFRKMCIKVYELDPPYFLMTPGLAWEACLKKTEIELELITDLDMFLMVEEGIKSGMCHAVHRYAKADSKYMKNYDKKRIYFIYFINKEYTPYSQYLDADNLYG